MSTITHMCIILICINVSEYGLYLHVTSTTWVNTYYVGWLLLPCCMPRRINTIFIFISPGSNMHLELIKQKIMRVTLSMWGTLKTTWTSIYQHKFHLSNLLLFNMIIFLVYVLNNQVYPSPYGSTPNGILLFNTIGMIFLIWVQQWVFVWCFCTDHKSAKLYTRKWLQRCTKNWEMPCNIICGGAR